MISCIIDLETEIMSTYHLSLHIRQTAVHHSIIARRYKIDPMVGKVREKRLWIHISPSVTKLTN